MTKLPLKERMKIERQKMPEQKPEDRINNFDEVPYGLTDELAILEASRCLECKNKPCVAGCPVNIDIPLFISLVAEGKFEEALKVVRKDNLLPAICGRVCPQEVQCEQKCVLAKNGRPVAIGYLERFVADYVRNKKTALKKENINKNGKRVAVIGSGPAGLTVAGDLIQMGYDITVYEALHKLGGVLVYGIPEFRLPKAILDDEINQLKNLGVEFITNVVVGMQYSINDLFDMGYGAVFLGVGAGLPYFMNIEGENLCGVYSANEFLTRSNLMKAYDFPNSDTPISKAKNVAVLGGGNVAMDAARTAKRLGAENVYIVYRRSEKEMPARIEEIHHAKEEGIEFKLLQTPLKFVGNDEGWLTGMECIKMELGEPDASGRRRPVPIKGSEFLLPVDVAIVAIGNGANPLIPKHTSDLKTTKWGNIIADPQTQKTSMKGVFAGGDIVLGAATVILAMGEGRRAAKAIDEYLKSGIW